MTDAFPAPPAPPALLPLTRIDCGAGERPWVPLAGGRMQRPEPEGQIVEGGANWHWLRSDGVRHGRDAVRLDPYRMA